MLLAIFMLGGFVSKAIEEMLRYMGKVWLLNERNRTVNEADPEFILEESPSRKVVIKRARINAMIEELDKS